MSGVRGCRDGEGATRREGRRPNDRLLSALRWAVVRPRRGGSTGAACARRPSRVRRRTCRPRSSAVSGLPRPARPGRREVPGVWASQHSRLSSLRPAHGAPGTRGARARSLRQVPRRVVRQCGAVRDLADERCRRDHEGEIGSPRARCRGSVRRRRRAAQRNVLDARPRALRRDGCGARRGRGRGGRGRRR